MVSKLAWGIGWTFIRHTKSEKLFFDEIILSKAYNVSAMTLNGVTKCKEKLSRYLENDIRNLVNFHASSQKSENFQFLGFLLSKAYKFFDEKIQKSYVSWHWRVIQSLKRKLILGPKNDMKNLVNFNASSENPALWCATLSKVCYVWAKKVERSYVS